MKKRVLFLTAFFPPERGGIQTYLAELTSSLNQEEILVVAPTDRNKLVLLDAPLRNIPESDAQYPFRIAREKLFAGRGPFRVWNQRRALMRLCKEFKPDVIVLGHFLRSFGYAARSVSHNIGVPVVQILHGFDVLEYATYSAQKKKAAVNLLCSTSRLVTTTADMRDRIGQAFDIQADQFDLLPPGVSPVSSVSDDQLSAFKERFQLQGKRVVLCVGRLTKRKGQDTLILALPEILENIPNAHLLLAGPSEGYRDDLERLVGDLKLHNNVTFTGEVSNDDRATAFASADVFCMPNREESGGDIEGFGIVFLEAMSAGLPVIGGRSGGVPEAILEDKTGLLVNGTEPSNVAETIARVLSDSDLASRLSQNGKEFAEASHWNGRAATFRNILSRVSSS